MYLSGILNKVYSYAYTFQDVLIVFLWNKFHLLKYLVYYSTLTSTIVIKAFSYAFEYERQVRVNERNNYI